MRPLVSSIWIRNCGVGSASDYVYVKEMCVSNNLTPGNFSKTASVMNFKDQEHF